MTEHAMHIDMVEVKSEDIMAERRSTYGSFLTASVWSIGGTIVLLALVYLIFG
ncbi:preprotein translocase subunit SecE [Roseococcus sp.]|uniref:preprotein translocase subunit SecE n=1 Tax=Roseococcus sp. TaxID=2109646 RepID=UPI003BAD3169